MIAGDEGDEFRPPAGKVLLTCPTCRTAMLAALGDPCTGAELAALPRRLHRGTTCPAAHTARLVWPDGTSVHVETLPRHRGPRP